MPEKMLHIFFLGGGGHPFPQIMDLPLSECNPRRTNRRVYGSPSANDIPVSYR